MTPDPSDRRLRLLLWLDALTCAGSFLLIMPLRDPLAQLTGLPQPLLLMAALLLLPVAAILAVAALRPAIPAPLVRLVVAVNLLWSAVSALVLLLVPLTPAGVILVLGQLLIVLATAWVQHRLLDRHHSTLPLSAG